MIPMRTLLSVAALVVMTSLGAPVHAITTTLGAGVWTLSGSDDAGNNWSGSTITFESQLSAGDDYSVSGYFYWTGNDGSLYGRENFVGTLFENNHLSVTGFELVPPVSGISTGATYDADVTADGRHMVNGTWSGGSVIPSQAWTAVQAIPEPASVALLVSGLGVLVGVTSRGRRRAG